MKLYYLRMKEVYSKYVHLYHRMYDVFQFNKIADKLSIDLQLNILSFLPFDDVYSLVNKTTFKHILRLQNMTVNYMIADGIYYNLCKMCYHCGIELDKLNDYVLNICVHCTENPLRYMSYPMICRDCVQMNPRKPRRKKAKGGLMQLLQCKVCQHKSVHVVVNHYS